MDRLRAALAAIREDPSVAEKELEAALDADRRGFFRGLAVFVAATLAGIAIDPDDL